ncbi:MAG: hypothetical protein GXP27_04225 [Planctomycetes bacterium]|nr:hypothetical protein [Planctomycetota bacterium]
MVRRIGCLLVLIGLATGTAQAEYRDRLVWIFGWNLRSDEHLQQIEPVLRTAAQHGYNGIVLSANLGRLCKQPPEYFQRLRKLAALCEQLHLEIIPAAYGVGYGGEYLAHDRNLAEGIPVRDATFVVHGREARHVPDPKVRIANGGFEEFKRNRMAEFRFHDEPGTISFPDTKVKHSGRASLRFENFRAHRAGNARVMQEISVRPYRCYRVSLWVKTENVQPANAFRILVLAGQRNLAPRSFRIPSTADWRKVTMVFNSLNFRSVRLYAGLWGGRSGRFWIDDWTIEEVGPINVLRRPGTPVIVTGEDGTIYVEGRDFKPLVDPRFNFYRIDRPAPTLKLTSGSRIREGQRLRVTWYHPMVVHDSQVTVCMAEPELYEILRHEVKLLNQHLQPRRVLLNMDEIRMGGTCAACANSNMAELLGRCITRQVQILRQVNPHMQVLIWSDMLDPNHNAHGDYYLVQGDFTGVWNHVPKDLVIAVWGGRPRPESLRFFADHGFATLVSCYYDAPNLEEVKGWLRATRNVRGVRGFMYTTWQRKYDLLAQFGDLIRSQR